LNPNHICENLRNLWIVLFLLFFASSR